MDKAAKVRIKLKKDLIFYALHNLKITTKEMGVKPLVFNKAQLYLHKKLEEQKAKQGFVRAIVLKGRQQGCSTYVGARFYHKIVHSEGAKAFVMAHDRETTKSLFEMSLMFYSKSESFLKPSCSQNSQNRLFFDKINSGFKIGTAGFSQVGRGQTIHYAHGSEVAFWDSGGDVARGIMQAVPNTDNTEIILESTSQGKSNFFYQQWVLAERGESSFIPVFIPWYWQEEYVGKGQLVGLTAEEKHLKEVYSLQDGQLLFRRNKIAEMSSDGTDGEWAFKREYPNSAQEAFETKDDNSFIKDIHVSRARRCNVSVPLDEHDLILGVDVARFGDDKTSMVFRKANIAFGLKSFQHKNNMEVAGMIAATLERHPQISKVYIDLGGGAGVVDRLHELGYIGKVVGVNFGSAADNDQKYYNKRAEMWGEMRQWLADGDVKIPDDDLLHNDLIALQYGFHSDSKIKLEKKEDLKKRTGRSPDAGDALALTFANMGYDLTKINLENII